MLLVAKVWLYIWPVWTTPPSPFGPFDSPHWMSQKTLARKTMQKPKFMNALHMSYIFIILWGCNTHTHVYILTCNNIFHLFYPSGFVKKSLWFSLSSHAVKYITSESFPYETAFDSTFLTTKIRMVYLGQFTFFLICLFRVYIWPLQFQFPH